MFPTLPTFLQAKHQAPQSQHGLGPHPLRSTGLGATFTAARFTSGYSCFDFSGLAVGDPEGVGSRPMLSWDYLSLNCPLQRQVLSGHALFEEMKKCRGDTSRNSVPTSMLHRTIGDTHLFGFRKRASRHATQVLITVPVRAYAQHALTPSDRERSGGRRDS